MRDGSVEDICGCAASFYPPEIDDLVCGRRPERYEVLPNLEKIEKTSILIQMKNSFQVVASFFYRKGGMEDHLMLLKTSTMYKTCSLVA